MECIIFYTAQLAAATERIKTLETEGQKMNLEIMKKEGEIGLFRGNKINK